MLYSSLRQRQPNSTRHWSISWGKFRTEETNHHCASRLIAEINLSYQNTTVPVSERFRRRKIFLLLETGTLGIDQNPHISPANGLILGRRGPGKLEIKNVGPHSLN